MGETEQPLNCSNSGIQPGDRENLPLWEWEVPTLGYMKFYSPRKVAFFIALHSSEIYSPQDSFFPFFLGHI